MIRFELNVMYAYLPLWVEANEWLKENIPEDDYTRSSVRAWDLTTGFFRPCYITFVHDSDATMFKFKYFNLMKL